MGYPRALAFATSVAAGELALDTALMDHFTANIYPPVPLSVIPTAKKALECAQADNWDEIIPLPDTLMIRDARGTHRSLTARKLIELLHLEAYIDVLCEDADHA